MDRPILMADIIESRKTNSRALLNNFRKVIKQVNDANRLKIASPLTITLGDEFQGIARSLLAGVSLIVQIEELLIKEEAQFKLRYVLNIGKVDTPINKSAAYEMLGEGLTYARESLNNLKSGERRFLILPGKAHPQLQAVLNDSFIIYQSIVDSWKPKDHKIVGEFLDKASYKEVAETVGIDPSNAWRRRKSLKINEYEAAKRILMTIAEVL